ncbi:MAG: helix-hairpin-helix domain-containing protein [Chloroflexota bacterium]
MSETEKININTANHETLAALPGIGDALAERIIQYRENVHPFEEVIELTAVPGISERMVQAFADQVVITDINEDNQPPMMEAETAVSTIADTPPPELAALPGETAVEEQDTTMPENESEQTPAGEAIEAPTQKLFPADMPDSMLEETADLPDIADLTEADAATAMAEPAVSAAPVTAAPRRRQPDAATAAAPPANATNSAAISQRRGCVFVILSAILGTLLGSALTLAVLASINGGNLTYASSLGTQADLRQVQDDMRDNVATLSAANADMGRTIATLSPRLDIAATQQAAMAQTMATTQANLNESAAAIATLQTSTTALNERVSSLADAAANFDLFLNGLRDLLFTIQGAPETAVTLTSTATITATTWATPTATPTVAEAAATATATAVATATPTPTLLPTRTPRPTATPIVRPTVTATP